MVSLYKPVKWRHCPWSQWVSWPTCSLRVAAPSCVSLQESRFPFYTSWGGFGKSHRSIRTGLLVQGASCVCVCMCVCVHAHICIWSGLLPNKGCESLCGKEGWFPSPNYSLHPSSSIPKKQFITGVFKNWCHFIVCFRDRAKCSDVTSSSKGQGVLGSGTRKTTGV